MKKPKKEKEQVTHTAELTALQHWLERMLDGDCHYEFVRAFYELARAGKVAVSGSIGGEPIFTLDISDIEELDCLINTIEHATSAVILQMCANQELCFKMSIIKGKPELIFRIFRKPPNGPRIYRYRAAGWSGEM